MLIPAVLAVDASTSNPEITYGFDNEPSPAVTPFAAVNPASLMILIGA
jgi:hypothetical protein